MLQSFPPFATLGKAVQFLRPQLLIADVTGEVYRCSIRRYPMECTVNYASIGVSFLLLREM